MSMGDIVDLGRIGLVKFVNPEGLQSEGLNLYSATTASGGGNSYGS